MLTPYALGSHPTAHKWDMNTASFPAQPALRDVPWVELFDTGIHGLAALAVVEVKTSDRGALMEAVELATAEARKAAEEAIPQETFVLDLLVSTSNYSGGVSVTVKCVVAPTRT